MNTIEDRMVSYSECHTKFWNKTLHFIGVPLIIYATFIPMGWFRLAHFPNAPISGATLFVISVLIWYWRLDRALALLVLPLTVFLLMLSDIASQLPFLESLTYFWGFFFGGWIIQFLGHVIEGKKPALVDNASHFFSAPLFLSLEILVFLQLKKDMRGK